MDPESHWLVDENTLPRSQDVRVYVGSRECMSREHLSGLALKTLSAPRLSRPLEASARPKPGRRPPPPWRKRNGTGCENSQQFGRMGLGRDKAIHMLGLPRISKNAVVYI